MPGTGNLTIDGAGWKGPIPVDANKRIYISHRLDMAPRWCARPRGEDAPDDSLVGHPLLSDTQRVQNGVTTPFGYDADLYICVTLESDAQKAESDPVIIAYTLLD